MLRYRIVCGISDDTIQCRLLAESRLTFKKALEISQGIEAANRNMCELHRLSANNSKQRDIASVNNEINKVAPNPTGKSETCYYCGKTGHKLAACRFKDATCRFCGKVGRLKAVCYSRNDILTVTKSCLSHRNQHTIYTTTDESAKLLQK